MFITFSWYIRGEWGFTDLLIYWIGKYSSTAAESENAAKRTKIEEVPELIAVASDDKEDDADEEEPSKWTV